MRASIPARFLVLLTLAAAPAFAAGRDVCEHALAKASAKFVGSAFKSAQRCISLRGAGKIGAASCQLATDSTGDPRTDAALGHAESHLRQGLGPCSDALLATMGFDASCPGGASRSTFGRGDLQHCIAVTHMRAVQALVSVQFPQEASTCGNGVVDPLEDCDPVANPTECLAGETCVPAGSPDECTCIEGTPATCGNGTKDATEACDPAAVPTGCPAGMTCVAAGQANECTCSDGSGSECQGTCTPTCAAGQTCVCHCVSGTCGNGTRDAGEQCDPMANPSGCATGMVCGAPGTTQQCTCFTQSGTCGNGMLDAGESCDPALPNTCDPGEVCLSSGAMACTCGAPPSNCGNGMIEWGEQCDPSANPTGCPTGMTCGARSTAEACTCTNGGGAMCGNGTVDAGEACDPAANPTGCAAGQTCSGQCTCSGGGGSCGNGTIDTGEQCDPTANPPGCPAGVTCSATCACGSATTTTTLPGPPSGTLTFTTTAGTSNCGGAGLIPPPGAPFSGELDSDTAGTTKIVDLGLGCLYIGGGNASIVPPDKIPDGANSIFGISGANLAASSGTSPANCTKGAGPGKHCVNTNPPGVTSCTTDSSCPLAGQSGACQLDANCFFGPPLPIPNPTLKNLTTCVLNVIQTDASGTLDQTTGASSTKLPLASRVHVTSNLASPCPKCVGGTCNAGPNVGKACTAVGSLGTTLDCPPDAAKYIGSLPVNISPLTTGTATMTAADGNFCPGQMSAGAFGEGTAKRIAESGMPAGNLGDHAAHPSKLAAVFCIPTTGNAGVDGAADLPGPGAIGLNGDAKAQ